MATGIVRCSDQDSIFHVSNLRDYESTSVFKKPVISSKFSSKFDGFIA